MNKQKEFAFFIKKLNQFAFFQIKNLPLQQQSTLKA